MKCACFTLVELLVVVGIMALFMAILIPSLQNSRQQAKAVLCRSNIKELFLGLLMYETENGTFPYAFDNTPMSPPPGGYAGHAKYDREGWRWFNHMEDYFSKEKGKKQVLWCPSRQVKNSELDDDVLCGNYGVNQSICKDSDGRKSRAEFIGTPLCTSGIPHPAKTLLLVDSGYSTINWWHATDILPPNSLNSNSIEDRAYIPGLKINKLWPGQEQDAVNGRHPNKTVNVGFADGHIDRLKAEELFVEKTTEGYKNQVPLWFPK